MTVVAHFKGGPLNGVQRAMESAPLTLRFPAQPSLGDWAVLEPSAVVQPLIHEYRRTGPLENGHGVWAYVGLFGEAPNPAPSSATGEPQGSPPKGSVVDE